MVMPGRISKPVGGGGGGGTRGGPSLGTGIWLTGGGGGGAGNPA